MARQVWYTLSKQAPTDGQHVWIRIGFIDVAPFAAVWNEAYQTFVTDTTNMLYPPWTVTKWRPY
jgi:hypothetical protein